jgi:glycerol-3-phosphate dehydrogenase (NAD(P)+)
MGGKTVSVIGAGAWGTALGFAAYRANNKVMLWNIDQESVDSINQTHKNPFLPGIDIPKDMSATADLAVAMQSDVLMMVVPAQVMAKVCQQMKEKKIPKNKVLILCSKGIEQGTLRLMSEIIHDVLPNNPVAVLSGPNFADEVARGEPAATTLACADEKLGMELLHVLGSPTFRTYYSDDIIGAQLGGSVKNVLAIACGISLGKGFGENTKVAIVTRGITELSRLCVAKGGKADTLLGLCGIGDMMLTCGTPKSRNMSLGKQLGEGKSLKEILAQGKTVEGVATAQSVSELAKKLGVDMPICEAVKHVLHDGAAIDMVIKGLMSRPLTAERV